MTITGITAAVCPGPQHARLRSVAADALPPSRAQGPRRDEGSVEDVLSGYLCLEGSTHALGLDEVERPGFLDPRRPGSSSEPVMHRGDTITVWL